jgi:hypothetical protein
LVVFVRDHVGEEPCFGKDVLAEGLREELVEDVTFPCVLGPVEIEEAPVIVFEICKIGLEFLNKGKTLAK